MKIRVYRVLSDRRYRVAVHTQEWSEVENRLIQAFGDPQLDLGGEITGPDDLVFTLAPRLVTVKGGSPFVGVFDARDGGDALAKAKANAWLAAIVERVTAAVLALRAQEDGFTGESLYEV